MAKAYREYKVSELKEMLTKRDLAVSGTKPELIARLEANDSETNAKEQQDQVQEEASEKTETVPDSQPKVSEQSQVANAQTTDAAEPESASTAEPEADPTQAAIQDLEKRIERTRRFGEPTEELERQLKRIQRFGYTPPVKSTGGDRVRFGHRHKRRNNQRSVKVSK